MKINTLQIQEFMELFTGSTYNYGSTIYHNENEPGTNKKKVTCQTVTQKLITIEEYKSHLNGDKGLGIVPINQDNKCKFGVIDIDIYDDDLSLYIEAIERRGFPLIPFRSKSGGLHLYIFFKDFEPASKVITVLKKLSALLSIDNLVKKKKNEMVEIFPKQAKLESGQVGNWINMPYYDQENTVQYAMKGGKNLSLTDMLVHAKNIRTSIIAVEDFIDGLNFSDAPPCLQQIHILNYTDANSGRNNFLFSFGVYLKKKDEDFFEQQLLDINSNMRSPLDLQEVNDTIIKSIKKKDYFYRCSTSPCVDFCNKKECQKREYGIGKADGYFSTVECGQLVQYRTAQPYYEWEVKSLGSKDFKNLRFKSEDEIIKQDAFIRLCMRELHELPTKLKQSEWFKKVNQHLREVKIVEVEEEDDTSPTVLLKNLIVEFLTGRALADTREQILHKRAYYDNQNDEYLFRVKDLNDFIYVQKQFKYFTPQELHGQLREFKCFQKRIRTEKGKQLRVTVISRKNLNEVDFDDEEFLVDFTDYAETKY